MKTVCYKSFQVILYSCVFSFDIFQFFFFKHYSVVLDLKNVVIKKVNKVNLESFWDFTNLRNKSNEYQREFLIKKLPKSDY